MTSTSLNKSDGQRNSLYQKDGFFVVPDALDLQKINALCDEAAAICRGARGEISGWLGPHGGQLDDDVISQYLCIHFPHKTSDLIMKMVCHQAIADVLVSIIGPNVKCMQSMLFIKSAGKPGQAWHQDEYYIPTRDRSLTGVWIAMDDATTENGCLWVIHGSHKLGVLWPQRNTDNDTRFDCFHESYNYPYIPIPNGFTPRRRRGWESFRLTIGARLVCVLEWF